ncbi:MAG: DUF4238 domain-containing protein [Candidatus Paceibacterota bacterium]|jgi:hypothetical protein
MRTENQHYIPQSYLRLFSEDQKSIWVYDKTTKIIRHQKIIGTGTIKNFYTSIRHPQPLDIGIVTQLEGDGISIIKKIDDKQAVTAEELGKLLNFLALQLLRTPTSKEKIEATFQLFWKELRKRYNDPHFDNHKKAEKIAENFIKERSIKNVSPKDFLNSEVPPSFPEEFFVDVIAKHGFKITEILSKQKWEWLFAQPDIWLTSDNPFSIFDPNDKNTFPNLSSNIRKIIPLSKKTLAVIEGEGFKLKMKQVYPWAVRVINLATASKAKQYVYSGSKKLLQEIASELPDFEHDPSTFIEIKSKK